MGQSPHRKKHCGFFGGARGGIFFKCLDLRKKHWNGLNCCQAAKDLSRAASLLIYLGLTMSEVNHLLHTLASLCHSLRHTKVLH